MRIVMVGTGYVGLVSGACLADFGHEIVCVDVNADKIAGLEAGEMPIYEPGLDGLVGSGVASGRLSFTTDLAAAMRGAEAVFIAVGTPSRRGDGHADLTYVHDATRQIAQHIENFTVVVTKSTVPVGTGDEVEAILSETLDAERFAVVSNPEFLREGAAIGDFKRPDRVVVGTNNVRAEAVMREIYRPLFLNETPILVCDRRTAEVTKYAANAFLATKITFINEMADLCEAVGANVQDVARGIGLDRRIGPKFLHAGPGYGGSCFPKDTLALTKTARDADVELSIVEAVAAANLRRKSAMADKIVAAMDGVQNKNIEGKRIAVLGLAFKPGTDDMRDAPSLVIIPALIAAGAQVTAFDPEAMDEARRHHNGELAGLRFADDEYAAIAGADALVIITEWNRFRALDLARIKADMRGNVVVDLRNIYAPAEMRGMGFAYSSVGRS